MKVGTGEEPFAFLLGPPGNGKTHLAIAALHMWVERNQGGRFWRVPDFLSFMRGELAKGIERGYGAAATDEIIATYCDPELLLVFDDYGTQKETEWASEQMYRILDERTESLAPTIITSNSLPEAISQRLRSRFRRGYVACAGKDLR